MRKVIYILIIVSLYSISNVKAQNLDSLKQIVSSTKNDTLKIRTLNKIAELYIDINKDTAIILSNKALFLSKEKTIKLTEIESYRELAIINIYKGDINLAIDFLNEALIISIDINTKEETANIYYLLGISYYNIDKYDKAIENYNKALLIAKQEEYKTIMLNCYNAIGVSDKAIGNYDKAIEHYLKSLKLAESTNNQEAISNAYNNIGVIYKMQELYDEAIEYYNKAYKIDSINNNKYSLMQITQNIGVIYKYEGELSKALKYFKKSLEIAFEIDSKFGKSKAYTNIAILYKKQKQFDKAIKSIQQSMKYKIDINDRSGQSSNYITLGEIHLHLADSLNSKIYLHKALNNFLNAYEISTDINVKEEIKTSAIYLKKIYEKLNKYNEALKYANVYINVNEDLYNETKIEVIETLKRKYESEKNQILIEKLQKEQYIRNQKVENQQLQENIRERQITLLITGIIALFLFLIYVLYNLRNNKKANQKFVKLNSELENKSKELKIQYLESVKQNIEIKTKAHEIEKQKQIITDKHKELQEITNSLTSSEEELIQQNEILFQQKEEIQKQNYKIEEVVKQFEDTIQNLEDVYFKTDRTFVYTQVSPSIKKHLSINSFSQIINKPLSTYWNITDNEIKQFTLKILRDKVINSMLFEFTTAENQIKYGKINARALYDNNNKFKGVEGIIRDVTADIEYQNKIKELSIQKEVLINNIPSSIYYKDINLRYLEVNKHFAELLGKSADKIIGKTDKEVASRQITSEYEELDKEVIKTKEPVFNYIKEHIDNNDKPYWVSTSKIPYLDLNNNVSGVIGVVRDITEQVKHEQEIKESKDKIEEAHKHITDNINYAKTIQQALLPTSRIISTYLSNYFVFYKPKEQVSGDFYYFKKFDKYIVFAAADCTGHGVSGGFLTMLGITHLNDIVSKRSTTNPAKALNLLREKIKDTYKLFGTETKDGLDIALCALNTETNVLSYAGAYNPLWIVREGELIEYKATRNPIGFYINEMDFKNHKIQLQKDDTIYIFSDGFADQFGGKDDKKYTAKRFKNLLLSVNNLSLKEQKSKLLSEFNKWKGESEQIDDVVIVGVKI